ncbi:MAG: hypothetical protein FWE57_05385 [Chitinispirillia bacterium]|nr:hypothetical protein [Chitinispirillia bacterium]
MRIYYWLISAFLLFPALITAQNDTGALRDTAGGSNGMNGMGATGYGAGWWFWTLLLLAILFTIVWWAVRAGSSAKPGRKKS